MVRLSAYNLHTHERNKRRNPHDLNAEELFLTEYNQCREFSKASNTYYKQLYDGVKAKNNCSSKISKIEMFKLHVTSLWKECPINHLLPRGETILDSMKADQWATPSWKQPVLEKVFIPSCLDIREFNISDYDSDVFQVAKADLEEAITTNRSAHFNTRPLPFTLETMLISSREYTRLIKGISSAYSSTYILASLNDDDLVEVPARFIISDGDAVAISLRFGWEEIHNDDNYDAKSNVRQFVFRHGRLQKEMRSFLSDLPFLFSCDADPKINCLVRFISDVYGIEVALKAVDLGAIAIAAGARIDKTDLFTLSAITTGIPFPTGIENMDQSWSLPLNELSPLLIEYTRVKFILLSKIYNTMMGSLLRTMFPDPDIVCLSMRMSQSTFVSWFSEFVACALQHALMYTEPFKCASRADMIRAIVHPDVREGELLADLVINVPVTQCGGERFLHHARDQFFVQFDVLKLVHLRGYDGDHPRPQEDFHSQRFDLMFKRNYINDDFHLPVAPGELGLLPSPQFRDSVYEFDVDTLTPYSIKNPKFHSSLHRVSAIQEWGRLNINKIPVLMKKLRSLSYDDLKEFWVLYIRAYDYLRGTVMRVRDERHTVFKLDQVLGGRCENVASLHRGTELKRIYYNRKLSSDVVLQNQQRRVDLLNERTSYLESEDRTGVHQAILKIIPGDFKRRNKYIARYRKKRIQKRKINDPDFVSPTKWKNAKKLLIVDRLKNEAKARSPSKSRSPSPVYNRLPSPDLGLQVVIKNTGDHKVDGFGPDEDIPLKGLLERLNKNSLGIRIASNTDEGALTYLIRNRTSGCEKLYQKWKKLRAVELENRVH